MATSFGVSSTNIKNLARQTTVTFNVGDEYSLVKTIGTGAYGVVCSAVQKSSGQHVAIKKISNPFDVLTTAKRTLRELKLLLHFKHDNIVGVKNILHCSGGSQKAEDVYVVMDLMESDLHHVIRSQQPLTEDHICYFVYQLLRGLKYIHSANVIHRDLKPSNLLVNENCELKIGDFGMARGVANSPEDHRNFMTEYVATRWYRAPELMLSMSEYSMAIDMWSVGCIFAEMIARKQLFPGHHYVHQLQLIISVLGSPSSRLVKSIRSDRVRSYVQGLPYKEAVPLKKLFPKASEDVIELLFSFLQFDPVERQSAESALRHPFFKEYHDQDDEPNCPKPFDFRFETATKGGSLPTKDSVKTQVIELIDEYHSKRKRLKKQLIFIPKPSESQTRIDQETPSRKAEESRTSHQEEHLFKRPPPPTMKAAFSKDVRCAPACGDDAVEMMSAKSDHLDVNQNPPDAADVVMHSATESSTLPPPSSLEKDASTVPASQTEKMVTAVAAKNEADKNSKVKKTISETTKMLVRDTILASMLAKKNGLTKLPEKPKKTVTAAERQREREEKRRKRQEKAAEKERKKRETEGLKPKLSEQDRSLLERWSKMQQQAKVQPNPDRKNSDEVPHNVAAVAKTGANEPLMSPNSLTRQSSLPSLVTPRERTFSNPEPAPVARRWSMNNELVQAMNADESYMPSLSSIPPSPMVQSTTYPRELRNIEKPASISVPSHVIHKEAGQQDQEARSVTIQRKVSHFEPVLQDESPAIHLSRLSTPANHQVREKFMPLHDVPNPPVIPSIFPQKGHASDLPSYEEATGVGIRANDPQAAADVSQHVTRPTTLDTSILPSETSGQIFTSPLSGLSTTLPSATLMTSGKTLVTLSPDTVDSVLKQVAQTNDTSTKVMITPQGANYAFGGKTKGASGEVLTLSPGKTSLVAKSILQTAAFTPQKSASIEFSPGSFLTELDKNRAEQIQVYSVAYNNASTVGLQSDSSKFLQDRNGSVMLSESASAAKNGVTGNNMLPLRNVGNQQQYPMDQENLACMQNEGMLGGYGIGYEPDLETVEHETVTYGYPDNLRQGYDMDCDSAKSSSSLLNDWLVGRMEEQDIEQLQRELELGSPMCIDDCGLKN